MWNWSNFRDRPAQCIRTTHVSARPTSTRWRSGRYTHMLVLLLLFTCTSLNIIIIIRLLLLCLDMRVIIVLLVICCHLLWLTYFIFAFYCCCWFLGNVSVMIEVELIASIIRAYRNLMNTKNFLVFLWATSVVDCLYHSMVNVTASVADLHIFGQILDCHPYNIL